MIEEKIKQVIQRVLDVEPAEIKPDVNLAQVFGVDSTEMVEISVGIKKALGVNLADNELKKTHSVNDIVKIIKSKEILAEEEDCGPSCGCHH